MSQNKKSPKPFAQTRCKLPASYVLSNSFAGFDPAVKTFSRSVFLAICVLAGNKDKTACPSQGHLAEYFGVSTRYIRAALKELLDFGYIIQIARKTKLVVVYGISVSGKFKHREDKMVELKSHSVKREIATQKPNKQRIHENTTRNYSSSNPEPEFLEKLLEEERVFQHDSSLRNSSELVAPRVIPKDDYWWQEYEKKFGKPTPKAKKEISRYRGVDEIIQRAIRENKTIESLLED